MPIVEIARFQLTESASPEEFAAADAKVGSDYVSKQSGFISRETAQGESEWIVLVHWEDVAAAERSMATYQQAPAAAEQLSMIDTNTMTLARYAAV